MFSNTIVKSLFARKILPFSCREIRDVGLCRTISKFSIRITHYNLINIRKMYNALLSVKSDSIRLNRGIKFYTIRITR